MNIPRATYRLQFQPGFGFSRAAEVVPYLHELGISHVYASPIFRARPGSRHGYDCVDPNQLNPELGSPEEWADFVSRLQDHGMGLLLDIVPNHMAFHADNPMLAEVLESGPASRFRDFFDICWDHPSEDLQGRVMAPFLGREYRECLLNGDIRLACDADGFAAMYGDLKFPLRLESYLPILEKAGASFDFAPGDDGHHRLMRVIDDIKSLVQEDDRKVRSRRVHAVKKTLWELFSGSGGARRSISASLQHFNAGPGNQGDFKPLDRLLSKQHYRLCHWKRANSKINYRRFFDINELIALSQENLPVFERTHALLAELAGEKIVSGARVDHIDGLADPEEYLLRLRRRLGERTYLLVEKILAVEEPLAEGWPVQGTTGYDFGSWLNAVFVRKDSEKRFDDIYAGFSGRAQTFEEVVYEAKRRILETRLAGDLDNLTGRLAVASHAADVPGNLTPALIRDALTEILARFPVYRTYIGPQGAGGSDRHYVQQAVSSSIDSRPDLRTGFEFIRDLLLDRPGLRKSDGESPMGPERMLAVRSFQQLSSALMAKGFEDTAFYRYHRLASLNEVGGEPGRFGCRRGQFHAALAERARQWPHAMNSTATHDSKRGEDTRARLNVLTELPDEWGARLESWRALNRGRRIDTGRGPVPDRNTEYLLYQTLVGSWPVEDAVTEGYVERIKAYMIKAVREAGEFTSWIEPREEYESGLEKFVDEILDNGSQNHFIRAFAPFCEKIAHYGRFNSLSQVVLKMAAPGVPDFYQGTELPQLALVDPDNRRPVSYDRLSQLLGTVGSPVPDERARARELLQSIGDGRTKLFAIARTLAVRRRRKDLFERGRYVPLNTRGAHRRRIIAFARVFEEQWCVAVVPRFLTELAGPGREPLGTSVWQDTEVVLPSGAPRFWQNAFTRQQVQVREFIAAGVALEDFPVALLTGAQK